MPDKKTPAGNRFRAAEKARRERPRPDKDWRNTPSPTKPASEGERAKPARAPRTGSANPANAEGVRLQKVLAQAGIASRRASEELIDEGRVEVNGKVVREQGRRVDPETAVVKVDGERIVITQDLVHLALNKPKGMHSTMSDDLGRPCVGDLVAERVAAGQRLFHVGRLDADTEGLLMLTNDGDLAHRLMHPSYEVPKTYLATVDAPIPRDLGKRLRAGVELEDGIVKVDSFGVVDVWEGEALVKLVLHEGRKHVVRRLLEEVGHPVRKLVRTDIGPLKLGEQRPGSIRVLNRGEVASLYAAVDL
jgi:23S rRNA pseudouridine2605 synthase